MTTRLLLTALILTACGDDTSSLTPDAPSSAPACTTGPHAARADVIAESVSYLRSAFGVTTGFDGGTVTYSEAFVVLDESGCPRADWSAIAYLAPVDQALVPLELRASHDRVAAVWALNGRKFVVFVPQNAQAWEAGRLPDSVSATTTPEADPDAVAALVEDIRTDAPTLTVTHLDALGVVTIETALGTFATDQAGTDTVATVEHATSMLRASGLFSAIDWSGPVFRIPNEFFPGVEQVDDEVSPECLRTHTKDMLPAFTTTPALAAPLGTGPTYREATCE